MAIHGETLTDADGNRPNNRSASIQAISGGGAGSPGAWVKGFHGTVQRLGPGDYPSLSVRELALSRRSFGAQSMSVLTALEIANVAKRPVTLSDAQQIASDRAASQSPGGIERTAPWDRNEFLTDYIDRRLQEADVLFLPNRSRSYALAKRMMDIVGAMLLLIVTLPITVILIVVVRVDSPGPAIFRQQRVTRGGEIFTFYKFRTMWVDARDRFPELYSYSYDRTYFDGVFYKMPDDPRNTRVGRWLRRTTLDELPNLINVLKGDLSLIGPRPEIPEMVQYYRPEELACFFTKAGVSGLAQVAGRSLLTVRQRLELDVRYVAQQTLLLDLRIVWRTLLVVALGRGAF